MDIGIKIKSLRQQCDLTQEELADRCELTKGYISQLENELTSPSIQTLIDILSALGTTISEFFSDEKDEQIVFTKDDYFVKETETHNITWLIPNSQKNQMEPIIVELKPHTSLQPDVPHKGEEFGYVLNGEIVLHLNKKEYVVKESNSFYYESSKTHYIENKTDDKAVVIWVSSPPEF